MMRILPRSIFRVFVHMSRMLLKESLGEWQWDFMSKDGENNAAVQRLDATVHFSRVSRSLRSLQMSLENLNMNAASAIAMTCGIILAGEL